MKKIVLMAAALMAGYTATAQGFYVDASVGYALGNPTTNFGTREFEDLITSGNSTVANIYGTLGNGVNIAVTPGYFFNDHVGVELGLQGFLGMKTRVAEKTTTDDRVYSWTEAKSTQFRIIPSVVISTGNSKKISGYAKAGIIMPLMGATYGTQESSAANGGLAIISGGAVTHVKSEVETVTKGNISLGFRGAVGVNFQVSEKIALFAEVHHTSLTIKPKTRKVESYVVNGTNIIETPYMVNNVNASAIQLGNTSGILPVSSIETEYIDELSSSSNIAGNPNFDSGKAANALPSKTNFNQLGLNIGVKFNF